jgi:hypothetical protein
MRARKVITTILLLRQGIVGRRAKARGGTRHVDQRRAKIGACHAAEPLGLTVPQAQCTNKWGKNQKFLFLIHYLDIADPNNGVEPGIGIRGPAKLFCQGACSVEVASGS